MTRSHAFELNKDELKQQLMKRREQVLDAVAGGDFRKLYRLICEQHANTNDVQFAIAQAEFDQVEFVAAFGRWLDSAADANNKANTNKVQNMIYQSPLFEEVA